MVEIAGFFMRNPESDVCFAQIGHHQILKALRITSGPVAIAVLEGDAEEMFTSEIDPIILAPLQKQSEILIAHVGDDGKAVTEYNVPLIVSI